MKKIILTYLCVSLVLITGCKMDLQQKVVELLGRKIEDIQEQNDKSEELIVVPYVLEDSELVEEIDGDVNSEQNPISEGVVLPEAELAEDSESVENEYLIVIDAGHQEKGNYEKEPIGPGASEKKAKVSSGTTGVSTGLKEYELNLSVAFKLRDELENRGYEVLMIRESHNVDIPNSKRATIANEANADAFIRVHANGSEDSSIDGMITICQTSDNPYNGDLYSQSRRLSELVLNQMAVTTGASANHVWETDTMSGINWAKVPTTIVEMGYMTNPEEDQLMATEEYQLKIAQGIANGLDMYFER